MSTKVRLYLAAACLSLSVFILATLYAMSPMSRGIYRGSFIRNFSLTPLKKLHEVDVGVNSYYPAGISGGRLYFANYTAPFHLLSTNQFLADTQHIQIKVKLDSVNHPKAFRTVIDGNYFFMQHGQMPVYLRGEVGVWNAEEYLETTRDYSIEAIPIGPNSLALKSVMRETGEYELGIKTDTSAIAFHTQILNKQLDGLFCLEGQLLQDKKTKKIIYIHQYRNEIVVADSILNPILRTHTIDTFSRARIEIAKIDTENMLSQPSGSVNIRSAVDNDLLYVRSNVLSLNEEEATFGSNSTIDVYDIRKNSYILSFYVPGLREAKARTFMISERQFIVLIDTKIQTYQLPNMIVDYLVSLTKVEDISRAKSGHAEHL